MVALLQLLCVLFCLPVCLLVFVCCSLCRQQKQTFFGVENTKTQTVFPCSGCLNQPQVKPGFCRCFPHPNWSEHKSFVENKLFQCPDFCPRFARNLTKISPKQGKTKAKPQAKVPPSLLPCHIGKLPPVGPFSFQWWSEKLGETFPASLNQIEKSIFQPRIFTHFRGHFWTLHPQKPGESVLGFQFWTCQTHF